MNESEHARINRKKWDRWAENADNHGFRSDFLEASQDKLISLLEVKENMNFLDIGCGAGRALGEVAKVSGNKGSFYGVDLSRKMIERAKENFRDKENFCFIEASSESIPLENNSFDIIICTNSFHHYFHPEKSMDEIFRLLKEGGKIYILDPTADLGIIRFLNRIMKILEPEHVKLYSTKEFKNLMEGAGLTYLGCKPARAMEKVHMAVK